MEGARRRVTQLQLKIQQETGGLVVSAGRLSSRKGSCRWLAGSVRGKARTEASRVTQHPGRSQCVLVLLRETEVGGSSCSTAQTGHRPHTWDPVERDGLFLALQQLIVAMEMERNMQ